MNKTFYAVAVTTNLQWTAGRYEELLETSSENYVHTSEEMVVKGTHKQLVLK